MKMLSIAPLIQTISNEIVYYVGKKNITGIPDEIINASRG